MNHQLATRMRGEKRAERSMLQLVCGVSIWRTAATQIVPVYGVSSWWLTILCLLPGFAMLLLLRWSMKMTDSSTVLEMMRVSLGRAGAAAFSLLLGALLLSEAVLSLTALLTVFTQSVGTKGTRFTLAVLTGAVMLWTLQREGLPRAVYFLRWGLAAAAVLLAASAWDRVRTDHLFPLLGAGVEYSLSAFRCAAGLAWPVLLMLTVSPARKYDWVCSSLLAAAGAAAALVMTVLVIPHGLLIRRTTLAECMLQPTWYFSNALRLLWLCLLMLAYFLAIAAMIQLSAQQLNATFASMPAWLPYALLGGVVLTQMIHPEGMRLCLQTAQTWLVLAIGVVAVIALLIAFIRRKRK